MPFMVWEAGVSPGWTLAVMKTTYLFSKAKEVSFFMVFTFNWILGLSYLSFSWLEEMIKRWTFLPSTDFDIISLLNPAILLHAHRVVRLQFRNQLLVFRVGVRVTERKKHLLISWTIEAKLENEVDLEQVYLLDTYFVRDALPGIIWDFENWPVELGVFNLLCEYLPKIGGSNSWGF